MRIPCPFCGERDAHEFTYLGDATVARPDAASPHALDQFIDATYQRDNPAGPHEELWYHGAGCRSWLRVRRNTRTHQVLGATLARDAGGA